MPKKIYLAFLRGINVGGNNIIKMVDLKDCFEKMNFTDVKTYIQSGNVIFGASIKDEIKLEEKIEKVLSAQFKYKSCVVVIAGDTLKEIVKQAPKDFGKNPEEYRYNVLFIKNPQNAKQILKVIEAKEGVDSVVAGKHAIYFSNLISKATQSRLNKIIQKPEYKYITIRNWNTTTKLLALINHE